MKDSIGRRIKEERSRLKLTQDELIRDAQLDWDRQTLGQVENGDRDIKAWELAKISAVLRLDMTSFFPSDRKATQPTVLWRQQPENHERLEAEFVRLCKDYKFVEELNHVDVNGFRTFPKKGIDLKSFKYRDAYALAEEIRDELSLGDYPASSLVKTLEEKYGLKFFFDGLDEKASAASSVSEYGACIVISASEPAWRQHFSIAHELFHIATWSSALIEQVKNNKELWDHNERLANSFAAGLLVPAETLRREIRLLARENKLNDAGMVSIARQFGVSLDALLWRMVNLHLIQQEVVERLFANEQLRAIDRESREETPRPFYFSGRFVRLAYLAYENGEISRGRLAKMFKQSMSALNGYLKQFGLAEVGNNEIPLSNP